ncbi:MAG: S4 domain-containing protein, partial [Pseudomonadota bacterium]
MSGDRPNRPSTPGNRNGKPGLKSQGFKDKPKGAGRGDGKSRGFKSHGDKPGFRPKRDDGPPRARPALPMSAPVEDTDAPPREERIAKRLARAGVASRREAEALIVDGRVSLNGKTLSSPAIN